MTSHPSSEPQLSSSGGLKWTEKSVFVPYQRFSLDGVGRGSAQDLTARPNAAFHPIREVELSKEGCLLQFEKPIERLNRRLSIEEVIILLELTRTGQRDRLHGQELYLYPGIESFAINAETQQVAVVLKNVRPKERFTNLKNNQLSVLAFLELIEAHCPSGWKRVQHRKHEILTLSGLRDQLVMRSWLQNIRTLFVVGVWAVLSLIIASIPATFFAPPVISEPLQTFYSERLLFLMDQINHQRSILSQHQPVRLNVSLSLPPLAPEERRQVTERLAQAILKVKGKGTIQSSRAVLPGVTPTLSTKATTPSPNTTAVGEAPQPASSASTPPSERWSISVTDYRGEVQELLKALSGEVKGLWVIRVDKPEVTVSASVQLDAARVRPPSQETLNEGSKE
jgi:hypothetical protein